MIKRINLLGGPGCGKSTMAAKMYTALKVLQKPVELVDEAIKGMAWQKIPPKGFDGVWLFGKQLHREEVVLRSGGLVVTSGPLILQTGYMFAENQPYTAGLVKVAQAFEDAYPSLGIWLERAVPYRSEGRYETSEQAKHMDEVLLDWCSTKGVIHQVIKPSDFTAVMKFLIPRLAS